MKLVSLMICAGFSLVLKAQNVASGISFPGYLLHLEGETGSTSGVLSAQITFSGFADIPAVTGYYVTNIGYGYGGLFIGPYGGEVPSQSLLEHPVTSQTQVGGLASQQYQQQKE